MVQQHNNNRFRFGAIVLIALSVSTAACATSPEKQWARQQKDSETCLSFGTRYGTPDYAHCMLEQQKRRDNASVLAAEKQRALSETVKNNVDMVRRGQCDQEAKRDRERGQRPRVCW